MSRRLEVKLFGQVEFRLEGEPVRLATARKSFQAFAYLLLHRGRPVARAEVAAALWPGEEDEVARGRLRATLSDLLKILPQPAADFVSVDDDETLRLNPALALELDVETFERAVRDPARLAEAVELYRGDLLAEFYDEWVHPERERFRERYLAALIDVSAAQRRDGRHAEALATARKALRVDPWREDVLRRVVRLRYELGDRTGALGEHADFARRLRDELGVEPALETQALAERLRRGDPDASDDGTPPEPAAPVWPRDVESLPFVGRDGEFARLSAAWEGAGAGRGALLLVGGPAGIGKSRLVLEFSRHAVERGGRALYGATGVPESFPYQSAVEALRQALPLVGALELGPTWFATLAQLLPELARRAGSMRPLPELDAGRRQLRLFEALTRTFVALSKARALLVVLEDLQWASDATLEVLRFLGRRAVTSRMLVIATFRAEESNGTQPALQRLCAEARGAGVLLEVAPLARRAVAELIERSSNAAGDVEGVYRWSNGNPLLLAQLFAAPREDAAGELPASLRALVRARAQNLSIAARTVAEIASLAGGRFSPEVVREVAAWSQSDVAAGIDELLERRIVREASGRGILRYAFSHQLVQQAIAELGDAERVRDRSRRMARALLDLYPERATDFAADIARHFENGGAPREAAAQYLIAAQRALALGAVDEARRLADRGLELDASLAGRREFLLVRHVANERLSDSAAQRADLQALGAIAESSADDELACTVLMARARIAIVCGDSDAAARLAELRERAARLGSARWAGNADFAESQLLDFELGLERGIELLRRAVAAYRVAGDDALTARATGSLARALVLHGELPEGREQMQIALQLADRSDSYEIRRGVLRLAAANATDLSDRAAVAAHARELLDLSRAAGDRREEVLALSADAWVVVTGDDFSQALPLLERAVAICEASGLSRERAMTEDNIGEVWLKLGAFATAIPLLERGVAFHAATAPLHASGPAVSLALARTYADAPMHALAAAHEALDFAKLSGQRINLAAALENLAEAEWRNGLRGDAIAHLTQALDERRAAEAPFGVAKNAALLAALHAEAGECDDALRHLAVFDELSAELDGDPFWPQRNAWAAAYAARRCGAADAAERYLGDAFTRYERCASFLDGERLASFAALPWHAAARAAVAGAWPTTVW